MKIIAVYLTIVKLISILYEEGGEAKWELKLQKSTQLCVEPSQSLRAKM